MKSEIIEKIKEHYEHAKLKHPYFCDGLIPKGIDDELMEIIIRHEVADARNDIKKAIEQKNVTFSTLLNCEVWEVHEAVFKGDKKQAIEECYDSIAILLRAIDVLEGRQALGDPKESEANNG